MKGPRLLVPGYCGDLASAELQRLIGKDLGHSIAIAGERALSGAVRASVQKLPEYPVLVWILTSGTSGGAARWIGLAPSALAGSARAVNQFLDVSSSDTWVHALPLFHVGGLGILYRAHQSGSRVASGVAPESQRWDPHFFADAVQHHSGSLSALVPTQVYDLVVNQLVAPSTLRAIVIGGARLDPELAQRARALGWPVLASYGMTESASQVATEPLSSARNVDARREPLLQVLPHAEITLDAAGQIQIAADSMLSMIAYIEAGLDGVNLRLDNPWQDGERAFVTSDLGDIPQAGWLRVAGRSGDNLKILGERVDLEELEGRVRTWLLAAGLARHDFALSAVPEERRGWKINGVYQASGSDDAWVAAVRAVLGVHEARRELKPFERIAEWMVVEALPRTELGKIRRRDLEREIAARQH